MKKGILGLIAVLTLCLSGCTPAVQTPAPIAAPTEAVTLHAITLGNEPAGGLEGLYEQLDALTVPELGCRLRFTYIPWGDERDQLNVAVASGEYDIIPQGNFSDYQLLASRNAFLDLKPYLDQVPALAAHYQRSGEDVLSAHEIDGRLYGIPQHVEPGVAANEGFFYREDLRKAWGLDPITSLETMEAYLYRAKEDTAFTGRPLITDNRIWTCLWEILSKDSYFEITSFTDTPYAVSAIDAPFQAVSRVETSIFRQMVDYLTKWYRDGILDKRLLTLSANEGTSGRTMMLEGTKPCETNSPLWTVNRDWVSSLLEAHPDWSFGFYAYRMDGRIMQYKTTSSTGSVLAVSSRTKHPEMAIALLEKLHTDQRYYDLLCYGVEGVHYHLVDGKVHHEGVLSANRYVGWTAATDDYTDREEAYLSPNEWITQVYQPHLDRCAAYTQTAAFHPLNDFLFNVSPVSGEAATLADAWDTYMMPILCGMAQDVDAELAEAINCLKAAGLDKYIAEIQKQMDAFAK